MKISFPTIANIIVLNCFYYYWIQFLNQFYQNHLISQTDNTYKTYESLSFAGLRPLDPLSFKSMFDWVFNTKENSEGIKEKAFSYFGKFFQRPFFPDT